MGLDWIDLAQGRDRWAGGGAPVKRSNENSGYSKCEEFLDKIRSDEKLLQIEGRECLLLFSAESFVFHFSIQKVKDQDI